MEFLADFSGSIPWFYEAARAPKIACGHRAVLLHNRPSHVNDCEPLNQRLKPVSRPRQLALILISAVAISSLISHATINLLGVATEALRNNTYEPEFHGAPVIVAGSSLTFYGLDWRTVAKRLSRPVRSLTTPAASPCELEQLLKDAPPTDLTVIGISLTDLNEDYISDFRADVVPLNQTARDLWNSHCDRALSRRMLGLYPLRFARLLYPTAGRAVGVLVGLRAKLQKLSARARAAAADPLPVMGASSEFPTNRLADWSTGRLLRNEEVLRAGCNNRHTYQGPKRLALERLLHAAGAHGRVLVVVMPLSPTYEHDMLDATARQSFEAELEEMLRCEPKAHCVRIDQIPELHSGDYFWDLCHLNLAGQRIATPVLLEHLNLSAPTQ